MQTLLDTFNERDTSVNLKAKNLYDLKDVYLSREGRINYDELKFHVETLINVLEGVGATNVNVKVAKESRKLDKLEFNPTVSHPNITFTDSDKNAYSAWYKPVVYVPSRSSAKRINPDFIFLKGEHESMYGIDKGLKKSLYSYEFLSDSFLKEASKRLLKRMKEVHLVLHSSEEYRYRDLSRVIDSMHYLNPQNVLVVSGKHLPDTFKMDLPVGVSYEENLGLNTRKLRDCVKQLF